MYFHINNSIGLIHLLTGIIMCIYRKGNWGLEKWKNLVKIIKLFKRKVRILQNCWHIECNALTASSFRIWNCSIGISSLETPGNSSMQSFIIPPVVYKGSTLPHPLQHLLFIDFLLLIFFYFIFFQCYSSILFRR